MATTPSSQRLLTIERHDDEDGTPTLICKGRINLESANLFRTEVKKLVDQPSHRLCRLERRRCGRQLRTGKRSWHLCLRQARWMRAQADQRTSSRVKDLLNITHLTAVLGVQ